MFTRNATAVLVHDAFSESASWDRVITQLEQARLRAVAVANPLRSLAGDSRYLRDVVASIDGPVVLAGHGYAGLVISDASAGNDQVAALVFVSAYVPGPGDSADSLSASDPTCTLPQALEAHRLAGGEREFTIRRALFRDQFAADVPIAVARLMGATQRPITRTALTDRLTAETPGWMDRPSWHVFGTADRTIPVGVHRAGAERALSRYTAEVEGASHAVNVSHPATVAAWIGAAMHATSSHLVTA